MKMEFVSRLLKSINRCLVPKLAKNYDESIVHPEFELRNKNMDKNFQLFVESLGDITKADFEKNPATVANMVNLYKELSCDCPWNKSKAKDVAKHLDTYFQVITTVHLDAVFRKNDVFNSQIVFDKYLEDLHSKLTYETFKMYPAQIEVYISIIVDLQEYNVDLVPSKIFPITLLLIEDYTITNKKKGLQSCSVLLQSLKAKDFENGNYYEVIYRSLKKNLVERDMDIVKLTHTCLLALLKILPASGKREILDELYTTTLDQLMTDSNLYKKAALLNFATTIIQWHKDNCANIKIFKQIVCDNLDICTNDAVSGIILSPLLKCLEKWITFCWPVWKFNADHKMLSSLFKVLYICKEDHLVKQTHKLIVTLICLCNNSEQKLIVSNLDKERDVDCNVFREKIKNIKADLKI
ncbi:uncharacterized protein LOC119840376 [Zerene cesonia]|uniref:uncharacterized protein LOC119840376 n=1 Tax=Zerene cesonia TaxID=33412 RepID=UPI0018E56187|nr:uncharacterized protein LOC119840376 [Zerene cesonia]